MARKILKKRTNLKLKKRKHYFKAVPANKKDDDTIVHSSPEDGCENGINFSNYNKSLSDSCGGVADIFMSLGGKIDMYAKWIREGAPDK